MKIEQFWLNGLACVVVAIGLGVDLAVGKSILWKLMLTIFVFANGVFFMEGIYDHNSRLKEADNMNRQHGNWKEVIGA